MNKISRFEVIVNGERKIVILHRDIKYGDQNINKIEYNLQDNNQTMKVFIN